MNSPAPLGTPLLPAATLVATAFCLVGALSGASVPGPAPGRPALMEPAAAEIAACEHRGSRSHAECVREAEGKALIRHAEWVAALEDTAPESGGEGPGSPADVIVVRAQRAISQ